VHRYFCQDTNTLKYDMKRVDQMRMQQTLKSKHVMQFVRAVHSQQCC